MDRLLRKHFLQEIAENLESKLRNIIAEPLSLQSLSRIVIRRSMGVDCHKNIHKLVCLPPALISLLNYVDFETE